MIFGFRYTGFILLLFAVGVLPALVLWYLPARVNVVVHENLHNLVEAQYTGFSSYHYSDQGLLDLFVDADHAVLYAQGLVSLDLVKAKLIDPNLSDRALPKRWNMTALKGSLYSDGHLLLQDSVRVHADDSCEFWLHADKLTYYPKQRLMQAKGRVLYFYQGQTTTANEVSVDFSTGQMKMSGASSSYVQSACQPSPEKGDDGGAAPSSSRK